MAQFSGQLLGDADTDIIGAYGIINEEIYQFMLRLFQERKPTEADRDKAARYLLEAIEKNNCLIAKQLIDEVLTKLYDVDLQVSFVSYHSVI